MVPKKYQKKRANKNWARAAPLSAWDCRHRGVKRWQTRFAAKQSDIWQNPGGTRSLEIIRQLVGSNSLGNQGMGYRTRQWRSLSHCPENHQHGLWPAKVH